MTIPLMDIAILSMRVCYLNIEATITVSLVQKMSLTNCLLLGTRSSIPIQAYLSRPIMAVVIMYTCISKAPSLHLECLAFHIYSKLNNPVRSSAQPGSKEDASEMVTPCY